MSTCDFGYLYRILCNLTGIELFILEIFTVSFNLINESFITSLKYYIISNNKNNKVVFNLRIAAYTQHINKRQIQCYPLAAILFLS